MADDERAPILRDASRLHIWVLGHFDRDPRPSARHLCALSMRLVDDLLLALTGRDRPHRLTGADDGLVCLRFHLRLAHERGELEERQLLHALTLADGVGRQLGGWIRNLQRVG